MKRSFYLLLILALLLLASALAPLLKSDPGHVLINFGDWTIETSVLVLVLALFIVDYRAIHCLALAYAG